MLTELELVRDFEAAQTRARESMDLLLAQGVNVTAFTVSGWPGVERAVATGRLFHPNPTGTDMVVLPIWHGQGPLYNPDPVLADLLAFQTDQPGRWYYRDGKPGLVLGDDMLDQALNAAAPVLLHPSPLAWLRSGCTGAVILEQAERRHGWGIAA
jgi:hypothetical protein